MISISFYVFKNCIPIKITCFCNGEHIFDITYLQKQHSLRLLFMFSCQKVFRDTGHNHCHKHQSYICVTCSKTMTILRLNIYTWSCRGFFYYIFRVFCRFNMLFTFLWSNTCSIIPHVGRNEQLKYILCYLIQRMSILTSG